MEKEKEGILLKSRSLRACVADGFRLYLGQFKRIFRCTWVVALVFAAVKGLFGTYYVTEYPRLKIAMQTGSADWSQLGSMLAVVAVGSLLMLVVGGLLASYVFSMLNAHKATAEIPWTPKVLHFDRKAAWRMATAVLWALLFSVVVVGIGAGVAMLGKSVLSPMAATGLLVVVLLTLGVLMVPLYYVFYKYLLTPGLKFTNVLRTGYAIGMRHLGSLLAVVIVTSLVVDMVALLLSLPMQILDMANIQAQTGVLIGDPLGMPTYMPKLTAAVFTLASFLQAYVLMAAAFPLYYAYGSIEADEEERSKAQKNIQKGA